MLWVIKNWMVGRSSYGGLIIIFFLFICSLSLCHFAGGEWYWSTLLRSESARDPKWVHMACKHGSHLWLSKHTGTKECSYNYCSNMWNNTLLYTKRSTFHLMHSNTNTYFPLLPHSRKCTFTLQFIFVKVGHFSIKWLTFAACEPIWKTRGSFVAMCELTSFFLYPIHAKTMYMYLTLYSCGSTAHMSKYGRNICSNWEYWSGCCARFLRLGCVRATRLQEDLFPRHASHSTGGGSPGRFSWGKRLWPHLQRHAHQHAILSLENFVNGDNAWYQ